MVKVKDSKTPDDTLTPADQRRQAIIENAVRLFRELLGAHIDDAVEDANDCAEDDEVPEAKLGFTVSFPTRVEAPELSVKIAWNVRRTDEATVTVDPKQGKLPL